MSSYSYLDQFSSESGDFESLLSKALNSLYARNNIGKVTGDESGSATEVGSTSLKDLTSSDLYRRSLQGASQANADELHTQSSIEYLNTKIRSRFQRYLDGDITLTDFLSNNDSDFDTITSLNSLGVMNCYKHGLSIGMQFTTTIFGKETKLFVISITDNTFTLSLFPGGVPFYSFEEGVTYILSLINNPGITAAVAAIKEQWASMAAWWDKLNSTEYPKTFLGLDISSVPIGILIKLGNSYTGRTFSNREILDVIKYFSIILRKMITFFEKNAAQNPTANSGQIHMLEGLNNLVGIITNIVDISATILDVVEIVKEVLPKFQILAKILGAWLNPTLLLEAGQMLLSQMQTGVTKIINQIYSQIESAVFNFRVPVPTFMMDFFLSPQPLPKAGLGFVTDFAKKSASSIGSSLTGLDSSSDAGIKAITDYAKSAG